MIPPPVESIRPEGGSSARRRLLIVGCTTDWAGIARLPRALGRAGFEVGAFGYKDSILMQTRFLDHRWMVDVKLPRDAFAGAVLEVIRKFQPDLLIPGDDPALMFLHRLHEHLLQIHHPGPEMAVFERSFTPPARRAIIERKSRLPEAAAELGLSVPPLLVAPALADAAEFAEQQGYPVVFKLDYTFSGNGVRVCRDARELEAVHREIAAQPEVVRTRGFSLQKYIHGVDTKVVFVARAGVLLAGFTFQVLHQFPAIKGPSSAVQLVEFPDLLEAVRKLVAWFGFTGFADAEFRIEEGTGRRYLIEINPRPVPQCHLGPVMGHDLCRALAVSFDGGEIVPPVQPIVDKIAFFPAELKRDSSSPLLTMAYHDVPWDDPPLLAWHLRNLFG